MQLPIRVHRGQKKPWGSIPRIDWSHPLAAGLVFYGYDSGGGVVIDLVEGRLGRPATTPPGYSPKTTAVGSGNLYVDNSTNCGVTFSSTPSIEAVGSPFTWASACIRKSNPTNNFGWIFGRNSSGGSPENFSFQGGAAANEIRAAWSSAIGENTSSTHYTNFSNNVFTSVAARLDNTNGVDLFAQGALVGNTNTITFTNINTSDNISFGSPASGSLTFPGFVFYGALWKRSLSASEILQLHLDPYSFLIFPEDEMFAELVGIVAGGTSVTSNFGAQFEFISNLRGDALVLLEYLASIRADSVAQCEAIAAVRCDNTQLPEFVAGLSANVASQLEFLGSMRGDYLGPLETASALRSDVIVLMETLLGTRSDRIAAGEIVAGLRADLVGPLENQGTIAVAGNSALQLEGIAKLNFDKAIGSENLFGVRSDAVIDGEALAGAARQAGSGLEFVAKSQSETAVQLENSGAIGVTGNAALQLETTAKLNFDQPPSFEITSGARRDTAPGAEILASAIGQGAGELEVIAGHRSDTAAQSEFSGAIAVIGNASSPVEIIAKSQSDARFDQEVQGGVAVSASAPVPIEVTSRFASFISAIIEIIQTGLPIIRTPAAGRSSSPQKATGQSDSPQKATGIWSIFRVIGRAEPGDKP